MNIGIHTLMVNLHLKANIRINFSRDGHTLKAAGRTGKTLLMNPQKAFKKTILHTKVITWASTKKCQVKGISELLLILITFWKILHFNAF